jgi:hypothetical protein
VCVLSSMPCREGFRAHRLLGVPGFPGLPVVDELHGTLHEEHKLLKEARDVDRPKPLGHGEGEQHDQPRAVQKKKPPRQVLCGLGAPALPRLPMQQARLATARQPLKPPPPTAHALPPNPRTSPAPQAQRDVRHLRNHHHREHQPPRQPHDVRPVRVRAERSHREREPLFTLCAPPHKPH